MYVYITTGATTQVKTGPVYKAKLTLNQAAAGTIKVIDGTAGSTANVATIAATAPAGSVFEFWDLQNGLRIINASTEDITVISDSSNKAR